MENNKIINFFKSMFIKDDGLFKDLNVKETLDEYIDDSWNADKCSADPKYCK